MKNQIVEFQNTPIPCTIADDGNIWVAIRPICESIGLNPKAALRNLKNEEILGLVGTTQYLPDARNHQQKMVCLPLGYLNGWLFSINAKLVSKEAKPKLIRYKKECYSVLFKHFFGKGQPNLLEQPQQRQRFEVLARRQQIKEEKGRILKAFYEATEEGQKYVELTQEQKELKKLLKQLDHEGISQLNQLNIFEKNENAAIAL